MVIKLLLIIDIMWLIDILNVSSFFKFLIDIIELNFFNFLLFTHWKLMLEYFFGKTLYFSLTNYFKNDQVKS
jgi:hypothetical protein